MKHTIALAITAAMLAGALPSFAQQPAPAAPARGGAGRGAAAPAAPAAPFAANIEAFRQADRANFPEPCQILLVGSSSIARWPTSAADLAPMKSINRGFGGSSAPDANFYFGSIVAPYRPRQIVWYEGDNDINAGRSPDSVVAEFNTFLALKDRALGTTPVYIIAIKPSRSREAQLATQAEANGKLKAIAAGSPQRLPQLPDVPTLAESGLKGVDVDMWYGFFLPKSTPPEIVERLNREVAAILNTPEAKAAFEAQGLIPATSTSAALSGIVARDRARWADVVAKRGIAPE